MSFSYFVNICNNHSFSRNILVLNLHNLYSLLFKEKYLLLLRISALRNVWSRSQVYALLVTCKQYFCLLLS